MRQNCIIYGSFKGMGDLLSAAHYVRAELDAGNNVKLLLFPSKALLEFAELIDFGTCRDNLEICQIPTSGKPLDLIRYFQKMAKYSPKLVWVSPHAPRTASSWKIPLLLWITKKIFWPGAKLAGVSSEHLSFLFDVRIPVSRDLPIAMREHIAYGLAKNNVQPMRPARFVQRIHDVRQAHPKYDLVIHPGANAPNRKWPTAHLVKVVRMIPEQYKIAVVGIKEEIQEIMGILADNVNVDFIAGSLEQAITTIAQARVLFCMDSGSVHFSKALGVPCVALFGNCNYKNVIDPGEHDAYIYERKFSCQPCGRATCLHQSAYCIDSILPETVASNIISMLKIYKA